MQKYTLLLEQEVSTPVMRSLSKYLKSQGYQVPDEVSAGGVLKIAGEANQAQLEVVLQNYIGSAMIQEIRPEE
jgi:hypothetical protein